MGNSIQNKARIMTIVKAEQMYKTHKNSITSDLMIYAFYLILPKWFAIQIHTFKENFQTYVY